MFHVTTNFLKDYRFNFACTVNLQKIKMQIRFSYPSYIYIYKINAMLDSKVR